MKSLHRGNIAGNAKLRGKKTRMLSCKCCTVENFKQECREKELEKEIKDAYLVEQESMVDSLG